MDWILVPPSGSFAMSGTSRWIKSRNNEFLENQKNSETLKMNLPWKSSPFVAGKFRVVILVEVIPCLFDFCQVLLRHCSASFPYLECAGNSACINRYIFRKSTRVCTLFASFYDNRRYALCTLWRCGVYLLDERSCAVQCVHLVIGRTLWCVMDWRRCILEV